jgi:hypothetical protein
MKLIIKQELREKALEAGLKQAEGVLGGHKVSPSSEVLIKAAVEAAIDTLEYDLA